MRRWVIFFAIAGLVGLIGFGAASARAQDTDVPVATTIIDANIVANQISTQLERIYKVAMEHGDRYLAAKAKQLLDRVHEAQRLYNAGDTSGAWAKVEAIAADVSQLIRALLVRSDINPASYLPIFPDGQVYVPSFTTRPFELDFAPEPVWSDSMTILPSPMPPLNIGPEPWPLPPCMDPTDPDSGAGIGPGGCIPPIMPPFPADSTDIAQALVRAQADIDSLGQVLAGYALPHAVELLAGASDLVDSAKAYLDRGQTIIAADRALRARWRIRAVQVMIRQFDHITDVLPGVRWQIDSLTQVLTGYSLPRADELLIRASQRVDSVQARLDEGRVQAAERNLERVRLLMGTAQQMIREYDRLSAGLVRVRSHIDWLTQVLAGYTLPRADELLVRAAEFADSVQVRFGEGRLDAARRGMQRIDQALAEVQHLIRQHDWLVTAIRRVRVEIDSAAHALTVYALPQAEELIILATEAADSAEAHLSNGHIDAAQRALDRAHRAVAHVQWTITSYGHVARGLERMRLDLSEVKPRITASDDSVAQNLYAHAVIAADSTEMLLADGKVEAAKIALARARMHLEHALFIVDAPVRAERAIAALRERVAHVLQLLPADAHRTRGIAQRAGELADSAWVLLSDGHARHALQLAEKTHRALDELMFDHGGPGPMPILTDSLVVLVRNRIGEAVAGLRADPSGTVENMVQNAIALLQQPSNTEPSPTDPAGTTLIQQAYQLSMQALDILDQAAAPGTGDEVKGDLAKAGEKAARDAAGPTGITDGVLVPTDYTITIAPNPFNPSTSIRYTLAASGYARLAVYNMLGQEVRVLAEGHLDLGVHEARWDGRDKSGHVVASGVYVARLKTPEASVITRLILSR